MPRTYLVASKSTLLVGIHFNFVHKFSCPRVNPSLVLLQLRGLFEGFMCLGLALLLNIIVGNPFLAS